MSYGNNLTLRTRFTVSLLVTLLSATTGVIAQPLAAGNSEMKSSSQQFCFPGRPPGECKSFLVLDLALLARIANSRSTNSITFHNGHKLTGDDFGVAAAAQAEFGLMINIAPRSALGVTAVGVLEQYRDRIGGKLRYRFWEGEHLSIDAGVGTFIPVNEDKFVKTLNRRHWIVGSLGLSQRNAWQFIFQIETYLQDFPENRRTSAFYSGVQFREWPGKLPALFGLLSAVAVGVSSF